ncbi:hypothetical protein [Dyadobacter helix]|uniref:hypothetical protein n=1 Tax=Dyadobacter helix TaxID=2822344 RepID=UPI001BFC8F45|nr:hypothetical protein [Dyadobacter sp. CECT 9275]
MRIQKVAGKQQCAGCNEDDRQKKAAEIKVCQFFNQKESAGNDEDNSPENVSESHGCGVKVKNLDIKECRSD